jgi:hypothetical protein
MMSQILVTYCDKCGISDLAGQALIKVTEIAVTPSTRAEAAKRKARHLCDACKASLLALIEGWWPADDAMAAPVIPTDVLAAKTTVTAAESTTAESTAVESTAVVADELTEAAPTTTPTAAVATQQQAKQVKPKTARHKPAKLTRTRTAKASREAPERQACRAWAIEHGKRVTPVLSHALIAEWRAAGTPGWPAGQEVDDAPAAAAADVDQLALGEPAGESAEELVSAVA